MAQRFPDFFGSAGGFSLGRCGFSGSQTGDVRRPGSLWRLLWDPLGGVFKALAGIFEALEAIFKCLGIVSGVLESHVEVLGEDFRDYGFVDAQFLFRSSISPWQMYEVRFFRLLCMSSSSQMLSI